MSKQSGLPIVHVHLSVPFTFFFIFRYLSEAQTYSECKILHKLGEIQHWRWVEKKEEIGFYDITYLEVPGHGLRCV